MITIAILTKNSERTVEKTLISSKDFDEVVILDTGSTDKTLEISKKFKNTKIITSKFSKFGILRNEAAKHAKNDWVLALDSDEVISKNLFLEISNLSLSPATLYSIPFINFYKDKRIKYSGWGGESHIRLYNKKETQFDEAFLHEKVMKKDLTVKKLKNPIYHYSYENTEDFLRKMQKYSTLFAKQNYLKKKSSLLKAIYHALFAFFKTYFLKRGFLDGKEGFIISTYNANTAFYKYLKLAEINKNKKCF